jgi:hypothetical protein
MMVRVAGVVGWVLLVSFISSCGDGGGSRLAFRALGLFVESETTGVDTAPTLDGSPDIGRTVSLSNPNAPGSTLEPQIPNDQNGDGDADGGFLALENLLATEGIGQFRAHFEYSILGAGISVPTDILDFAGRLEPVGEGEAAQRSVGFFQIIMVKPDLFAFLNQNLSQLPPFPFDMTILITVTGLTDSGEDFTTEELRYTVTFSS